MTPIQQEQVQQVAQVLLSVMSDERCVTPNNLVEGVVSGKQLLKAIVAGQLVVCVPFQEATPPAPEAAPGVGDEKDPEGE